MTPALLTKGERLLRVCSEHWTVFVVPLFLCTLVWCCGGLLIVASGYMIESLDWLASVAFLSGTVLMLAMTHIFFFVLLGEATSCFVITTHRVLHFKNTILIREEMSEVSFANIRTVEAVRSGILQYLLNYGSLKFEDKLTVNHVRHPQGVARDVHVAMGMR